MTPKVPQPTTTCCSTSNHVAVTSGSHVLMDASDDGVERGVKKQKYPLDDYLIHTNMHTRAQASLLSPLSPVSSPETVDVLQNAERLVQNAQQQIMEVSFNSALNTLDENTSSYIGQQPLDDSLMYLREMVNSKFQESNDPNTIYVRKASPNNAANSIRNLEPDQFPVTESSGIINNPLEISAQNSEFSPNQMTKGVFLQNEKPFLKKAANWFNIKPPKHIAVFPTSTTSNSKSKTKHSSTVPCCTMTNTGVIEINGRDHFNGTIQVQTGPTVDIRRGLTIQTIENVHISPDPSSVPIYNNIATYCFQHEPSTSYVDSNRNNSITSSCARDIFDTRKERHIQSTDYNDVHKIVHVESTQNAVVKDSIISSRNENQGTTGTQATPSSNSNNWKNGKNGNVNRDEIDSGVVRNRKKSDNDHNEPTNLHKALISNEMHLDARKSLRESVDNVAYLKKAVSINLTPVITSVYQEFPVADIGGENQDREEDFEEKSVSKGHHENLSNVEIATSYNGQKFHHVQSDTDYIQRSQACGNECKTGSCSRNCERDVEYREKVKLKQALETIANIGKIRFDIKDTGITPAKCTQNCEDKNYCNADTVSLEFEPLSQPERFKSALEELCKFSQKTEASQIDTDSKIYEGAIDAFVKVVFDLNTQSDPIHGLYSSDKDLKNRDTAARRNNQSVETAGVETKKEEVGKAIKQVKRIPEPKEVESRRRSSNNVKPKINNLSGRPKEPNKYIKSFIPQNSAVQKDKAALREKAPSKFIPDDEDNVIENLDLKQPCVSDLDAVLKTYRESMAAISRGTEQLSQLISHHIMKNALSAPDHIPSAPIPNPSIILGEKDVEPCVAGNERTLDTPISKLVSHNISKIPEHEAFIHQRMATDRTSMQRTCPNQIQSTKGLQQKNVRGRIPQRNCMIVSKDDAEFSNENNSVCTNVTAVSTTNECSSICSRSTSEQVKTLTNSDEKSSPIQFNVANDTSNSTSTPRALQQIPRNIGHQSDTIQRKGIKIMPKPDEKQLMNIQYCIPESFEAPISIEVKSDQKNSSSQSDLKNPLSTYFHLENACGKDIRLRRHSNYDIHSDEPGDFDLYKCPILISGQRDNLDASNHDRNDNFVATESVLETVETDTQVFGQILNAVKNSSQFMKRFFIALLNGMEMDSIHDVVKTLEDAAVPIVIEQLLVLSKDRNIDKSLFGGNLMLTNPVPVCDDGQKNYNEPKTNDFIDSSKHSIGFNGNTDVHDTKADPVPPRSAGDQRTESLDPTQRESNLNFEFNKDYAHLIYNHSSPGNEASKNKSPNDRVESEKILDNHTTEKELENNHDNLAISKTTLKNKSRSLEPLSKAPRNSLQTCAAKDLQEAKEKTQEIELCQSTNVGSDGETNVKECSTNSISSNAASKKNNSESNTEKDISFIIPHDADMNNDEVIDLSSLQKLTSVTLKNETTGEIIGFQIESNCRNCLRLNSFIQQGDTTINPRSGPDKSSVASNKSIGKLQNFNEPTLNHTNLTENLQKVDPSIVCHCRKPKDSNASKIESHNVPCESSLDAVNALIDSRIQSNYKQLGLIDPGGRTSRRIPDKATPISERALNKRRRPTQLSATSKSPTRKSNHPSRLGGKKNKSFDSKVSGNKKGFHDNEQRLPEGVKDPDCKDSEKSDAQSPCPLCIRLAGKCSCHNCANCNANIEKPKKIPPKLKKEKEKLVRNVIFPRHRSGSPKRPGNTPGRYSVRKELSPRPTPTPLASEKNANTKNIDYSQGVAKNDKKSTSPRVNLKPSSGLSSTDSNNDASLMNCKTKCKDYSKLYKDAASDSDNLKVDDKSQDTANDGDATTACKSSQTQHAVISGAITVCKSSGTLCRKMIISEEATPFSPKKLNKIVETDKVVEPPVKDVGTTPYFESCVLPIQNSPGDYTNGCCEKITVNMEKIVGSKEMENSSTMILQTSEICNNSKKNQSNTPETTPETGTVSVYEKTCPNIFDHEGIIVLQPLNELDHTFFIAKPNCVERKMIQEKLNRRFNVQVGETTCASIRESDQDHQKTKKELYYRSNSEVVESISCITSTMNWLKNKECQTSRENGKIRMKNLINNKQPSIDLAPSYVTGSHLSVLEEKEECADLCTNDEKCSRICSHPPSKIDDSSFHCREDCPREEVCLELCSTDPEVEPSLQISSININGILEKFVAENNVRSVRMPIVKDLLQELRKVEDLLKAENESFRTLFEKSEPQDEYGKNKMKHAGKLDEETEPRSNAEGSRRKSVQYEEPHEKMEHLTRNRKSLVLPNVVRGLADVHPSKRLEQLRLRAADPLVSGNFNKPESDKRYSVFNQSDPGSSSIILDDPRTQAHLASIAQSAKAREGEKSSSDSSVDILQSTLLKINKKPPMTGKHNNNYAAKLNKSKRGMDADSDFLVGLDERSINAMKSFESSDLEPGELLQVRTPFDKPIKSCQSSRRIDLEIGKVAEDQVTLSNLRANDENHARLLRNIENKNTQKTTTNGHKKLENKYALRMHSAKAVHDAKEHKSYSDKVVDKPEGIFPDTVRSIANESQKIIGKSYLSLKSQVINNDKKSKGDNSATSISKINFTDVKSNALKVMQRCTVTEDSEYSKMDNSHTISKVAKDLPRIITDSENIDRSEKFSERFCNANECNSRPQIIDHFLGNTKLEDMKVDYTNNESGPLSTELQSLGDNFQRLYFKSDFTSKTTHDSQAPSHSIPRSSTKYIERDLSSSNRATSKRLDQTSSDTYSEGEINLPSSCSYSLGEVKLSTPSSTTAGKSFKDSDGFTIFVTKSILDSAHGACSSPGEILADIQKTESDFSSSVSS